MDKIYVFLFLCKQHKVNIHTERYLHEIQRQKTWKTLDGRADGQKQYNNL